MTSSDINLFKGWMTTHRPAYVLRASAEPLQTAWFYIVLRSKKDAQLHLRRLRESKEAAEKVDDQLDACIFTLPYKARSFMRPEQTRRLREKQLPKTPQEAVSLLRRLRRCPRQASLRRAHNILYSVRLINKHRICLSSTFSAASKARDEDPASAVQDRRRLAESLPGASGC
ncbi:hypothetical protein [Salisediminibacterium halotolerans]|uniref:hypothetical protein n=1 Tax=Salisediminibacterium halotolerans TaxID=517425 RepID=UPI001315789F|nr:hypothetical protein [Salisediminibacterium halotolerans]